MTRTVAQRGQHPWTGRVRPTTRLGRIACWLALGFVAWFVLNQVYVGIFGMREGLPPQAVVTAVIVLSWVGLATGFAAGVVAATAVIRQHERSALVWLSMLPVLFVAIFLVGELLFPH